ncbi:hypothetical protein BD410DRAFT_639528 [Rickenella mellea]|uniref:Uncharacterized protein n=1 Tax=Rickenella mellea TaxID=50990 RepID=A0A4Y7QDV9_9AGAM|nr:hypothetical protein BD410DRAFT_639528 [Rickenella mellea]
MCTMRRYYQHLKSIRISLLTLLGLEYILCADCVFHETKEGAGHRPTHVFARFTGEPLPFKEDKEESEISRPAGTAKIETVLDKFDERLANQEKIMKSLAEQLEKQERLIQSLVDASSRDKGVEIVQHQDNAPL